MTLNSKSKIIFLFIKIYRPSFADILKRVKVLADNENIRVDYEAVSRLSELS